MTGDEIDEVNHHVDGICESPYFEKAPRRQELLRCMAQAMLDGKHLGEEEIAYSVYGMENGTFSRSISKIRVAKGNMWRELQKYYATDGKHLPLRIRINGYTATVERMKPANTGEMSASSGTTIGKVGVLEEEAVTSHEPPVVDVPVQFSLPSGVVAVYIDMRGCFKFPPGVSLGRSRDGGDPIDEISIMECRITEKHTSLTTIMLEPVDRAKPVPFNGAVSILAPIRISPDLLVACSIPIGSTAYLWKETYFLRGERVFMLAAPESWREYRAIRDAAGE